MLHFASTSSQANAIVVLTSTSPTLSFIVQYRLTARHHHHHHRRRRRRRHPYYHHHRTDYLGGRRRSGRRRSLSLQCKPKAARRGSAAAAERQRTDAHSNNTRVARRLLTFPRAVNYSDNAPP